MNARHARWGLGAVLGVVALVAALRSLVVYAGHGLWLGVSAVIALAAIQAFGFVTLGRARRRLVVEEARLGIAGAPDSTSELWSARRRTLQAIRDRGARPDLEALAVATAADEGGRAYLGRYLVAVTVLVGLVGTFAGLMETVRQIAPLLHDESFSAVAMVAGPLAGLDVTFGASVVGILVTLSLSLVQGDLVLAEERVLARLEERTRHELLPELWPPSAAAEERMASELAALRSELARFVERSVQASSERVASIAAAAVDSIGAALERSLGGAVTVGAESLRVAVASSLASLERGVAEAGAAQRLVAEDLGRDVRALAATCEAIAARAADTLAGAAARTGETLDGVAARTVAGLDGLALRVADKLDGVAARSAEVLTGATTCATEALTGATTRATEALAGSATQATETMASTTTRATEALAGAATQATGTLAAAATRSSDAVEASTRHSTQTLDGLAVRLERSLDALADGVGQRLEELARGQAAELGRAQSGLLEAARAEVSSQGERLAAAAAELGVAAKELRAGAGELSPAVARLTPELSALARELALVGARAEAEDPETLVLDELVRLGEGVAQLHELMALTKAEGGGRRRASSSSEIT